MAGRKRELKPWEVETFDIPAAAKYLGISEEHLLLLMMGRRAHAIRDKEDRDFVYNETRFKWEEIYRLRCKLDHQPREEKRKPQQLRLI